MEVSAESKRISILFLAAAVAVVCVGWGLFFFHVARVKHLTLDRAHDAAMQRSRMLREHADQAFTTADIALRSLDIRRDLPGIQVIHDSTVNHPVLRALRDSSDIFMGIGLVNSVGRISAGAASDPPPDVDLSDRRYFQRHSAASNLGVLIGAPIMSRPGGDLALPISRRLDDRTGNFDGVVAARIDPARFADLYRSAESDGVLLFRNDGVPLVAVSRSGLDPIERVVATLGLTSGEEPSQSGVASAIMPESGSEWLIGYSRSDKYDLAVAVGFRQDTLLADWRGERNVLLTAAAGATISIAALTGLLVRRVQRNVRMAADLFVAREAAVMARMTAESANRAKSEFLAHMSHELRTPLNAISGFSQTMADQLFGPINNPRYAEYARIVHTSAGHLLAIINNILDLAKVDAGKWDVEPQPMRLHDLADELRDLTKGRAEAHKVALTIDVPADLPEIVTDRRLLLQILVNLLTNAIKFTPEGGSATVTAHADVDGDGIAIVVADTGSGMTSEDLARVLQPFGRASSGLARVRHDTGLGLSLSSRFAELLGGRLEIESTPDKGTRVTVRLPLRTVPQQSGGDVPGAVAADV